jgi:hypothetical protein
MGSVGDAQRIFHTVDTVGCFALVFDEDWGGVTFFFVHGDTLCSALIVVTNVGARSPIVCPGSHSPTFVVAPR